MLIAIGAVVATSSSLEARRTPGATCLTRVWAGCVKPALIGSAFLPTLSLTTRDSAGTGLAMSPEWVERSWQGVHRRNGYVGGGCDRDRWRVRRWRKVNQHLRLRDRRRWRVCVDVECKQGHTCLSASTAFRRTLRRARPVYDNERDDKSR